MPRRTGKEALYPRVNPGIKIKEERSRALAKANHMRYDEDEGRAGPRICNNYGKEHGDPPMTDRTEDYNYGKEHTPKPSSEVIQEIGTCVAEANAWKDKVADLKDQLKKAEAELSDRVEKRIPELMRVCGLDMIKTPDGLYVELDKKLWANIPAPSTIAKERDPEKRSALIQRREAAIKWLEDNEHADLIKREFVVQFQKGDEAWAKKFRADLEKRKKPLHFVEGEDINSNSLSALVRQMREAKLDFPEETLGVYEKFSVKISK
jgi:hypothetical protein